MEKRNSSAYNRDVSRRKALRKRRIAEEVYYGGKEHPYYFPGLNLLSLLEEVSEDPGLAIAALEKLLALQNIKNLYSCITGDNTHSIEMHRSMGYELIGTFPKAGFKHDRWLDVVWMAKTIGEKENAPMAVVPFADVEVDSVEKVLEAIEKKLG